MSSETLTSKELNIGQVRMQIVGKFRAPIFNR